MSVARVDAIEAAVCDDDTQPLGARGLPRRALRCRDWTDRGRDTSGMSIDPPESCFPTAGSGPPAAQHKRVAVRRPCRDGHVLAGCPRVLEIGDPAYGIRPAHV